jgi:hypothetical protein
VQAVSEGEPIHSIAFSASTTRRTSSSSSGQPSHRVSGVISLPAARNFCHRLSKESTRDGCDTAALLPDRT